MDIPIQEHEFLVCQKLPITILPLFTEPRVDLLDGSIGPFRPNKEIQVPLWLALHMRHSDKCRVIPPAWLTHENLAELEANEKGTEDLL
jgi:GINS complex subunit 2